DVVVEVAGDHDRRQPARQLPGEVGPFAGQAFHPADAEPVAFEDGLALGGEEFLGDAVVVVHRAGAEFGVVRGELAFPGGKPLLNAGHDSAPSSRVCPLVQGCWSHGRSSGSISPPKGKKARCAYVSRASPCPSSSRKARLSGLVNSWRVYRSVSG